MTYLIKRLTKVNIREDLLRKLVTLSLIVISYLVISTCQAESRLKAHFSLDGKPYPASLTISDGNSIKVFNNVTDIDEVVPSKATYQIQWDIKSKRETYDVTVGTVRDVIPELRIPSNETLELNFYLFRPMDRQSSTPAYYLFAEEPDAKASVLYNEVVMDHEAGINRVTTEVKGRPNRRIFLGSWAGVREIDAPPSEPFCFISCATTTEVSSEVPGGAGGAEPEPEPDDGGDDGANSCIDDGTPGGGKNYPATIPETGRLKLITNINILKQYESELLLFAALRNGASIPAKSFEIRNAISNEIVGSSKSNPLFRVPIDLPYIYSFAVSKAVNSEETYRIAFPIKGISEGVVPILAFPPGIKDLRKFSPIVIGDTALGMAVAIEKTERLNQTLSFDVLASGVGWLLIPLPENTTLDEAYKLHGRDTKRKTELRRGVDYTVDSVEGYKVVVLKVEHGRDSYSFKYR